MNITRSYRSSCGLASFHKLMCSPFLRFAANNSHLFHWHWEKKMARKVEYLISVNRVELVAASRIKRCHSVVIVIVLVLRCEFCSASTRKSNRTKFSVESRAPVVLSLTRAPQSFIRIKYDWCGNSSHMTFVAFDQFFFLASVESVCVCVCVFAPVLQWHTYTRLLCSTPPESKRDAQRWFLAGE